VFLIFFLLINFLFIFNQQTPKKLKIMDSFCVYLGFLTIIQFWYFLIAGEFPKNSLIAGIAAPLGTLVITGKIKDKIRI
jgi:4-amino-4-deoxy-L-arabinose transferase-like glycosyltransferase